jgi:Luciferase-like monooxygenase
MSDKPRKPRLIGHSSPRHRRRHAHPSYPAQLTFTAPAWATAPRRPSQSAAVRATAPAARVDRAIRSRRRRAPADQIARLDEALGLIDRLWKGETITHEGRFFRLRDCKLHTLADRRPPIWVSAFGPKAAEVAGRWGDGLWTLPDPELTPELIDAYREARRKAGTTATARSSSRRWCRGPTATSRRSSRRAS